MNTTAKTDTVKMKLVRDAVSAVKKSNPTPGLFAELEVRQAVALVDAFLLELVKRTVEEDRHTRLVGFGTFKVTRYEKRGKRLTPHKSLTFKACEALRAMPRPVKAVSP